MSAFEDSLSSWEEEINKYEKETSSHLADDIKIGILMNETRGKLQEFLRLSAGNYTKYQDIKDVILTYFRTQASLTVEGTST